MVTKSLSHEKERLSKSSDNEKIEINEHQKQEIDENYSKVSFKVIFLRKRTCI